MNSSRQQQQCLKNENLGGRVFANDTLQYIHFSQCSLRGVSFQNASLRSCCFSDCVLDDASFIRSEINNCRFERCVWTGVNLNDSVWTDTEILQADWKTVSLQGCFMSGCTLDHLTLADCRGKGWTLRSCTASSGIMFRHCNLPLLSCESSLLDGSVFAMCDLPYVSFPQSSLNAVLFDADCKLTCPNFSYASLQQAAFQGLDMTAASLRRADLSSAVLQKCCLCMADLSYANCTQTDFSNGDLSLADMHMCRFETALMKHTVTTGIRKTDPLRLRAETFTPGHA